VDPVYLLSRTDSVAMWWVFRIVCVWFVNAITHKPFDVYHREIFTGAKYDLKLGHLGKWLHFDGLRRTGADLTSLPLARTPL